MDRFLYDLDLLDDIFIHEFEADGQPQEEEEDEDFSMDDEGGEGDTPPAEDQGGEPASDAPPADDEGEEEFSMDDEGEDSGEETPPADNPQPASEEPASDAPPADDGEEEFSMDDEGSEGGGEDTGEAPPADDEGEENYEIPDEEGEGGQEGGEGDAPPADDGEEEFSMDDDSGEGGGEGSEGGEEAPAEDQGGEQSTDDTSSEDSETNSKLKELETVVFDDLTEDEKNMKITELKALYITVYKKCGTISEMLAGIKKDEETIQIIEYISNTLIDLREYVNDYINKVFDSKTYIENLSQLQKYIMIFNAINKVFEQIKDENVE